MTVPQIAENLGARPPYNQDVLGEYTKRMENEIKVRRSGPFFAAFYQTMREGSPLYQGSRESSALYEKRRIKEDRQYCCLFTTLVLSIVVLAATLITLGILLRLRII